MNTKTYDVVIVGGGIIGSASAYYLMKADPTLKLTVIERDSSYSRSSTTLSMSNVRIQFSLPFGFAFDDLLILWIFIFGGLLRLLSLAGVDA